jgi:hypothetical protein
MNDDMRKGFWGGYIFATVLYIVITMLLILSGPGAKADDDCDTVECLIASQAREQGVPVEVAIAVGKVESSLRQSAIGPFGEIGVFQIRPQYTTANIYDLKSNIREGVRQLAYWHQHCPVQEGISWVNCYNAGMKHPKYPLKRPYVQKITLAMRGL